MEKSQKFNDLTLQERITKAKEKTARVVDHLLYLIELHENNAIILYSQTLSSQIPESFAANAFNTVQRGLHQFEIVRLCALWDTAAREKENIPTVIELIDAPDIFDALAEEAAAPWRDMATNLVNPSSDPALQALELEAIRLSNHQFASEQAQRCRDELRKAIDTSCAIMSSPIFSSIMNLRDKHLAHSLSKTYRENKFGTVAPMKYGDERKLLNDTLPIAEALYCWVNGKSFSFEDSRNIDRKNAKALWEACTFSIPNVR